MYVNASGIDFRVPGTCFGQDSASGLLPGLFHDRLASRSHTCIINETCHAARAINFDVQIRNDTDQANDGYDRLSSSPYPLPTTSNFSKRHRNMNCLTPGTAANRTAVGFRRFSPVKPGGPTPG